MVARSIENTRRLIARLGHGIAHPEQELSRLQKFVVFAYDLARHGWTQLNRDNAPQMAAALAYRTLFSLVPVLVIALVMARSFYGEQGIRSALEKFMEFTGVSQISQVGQVGQVGPVAALGAAPMPGAGGEAGDDPQSQVAIAQLLEQWVTHAIRHMAKINFGAIAVVSIGVFIYAAIILLVQIEQSFNTVCQAPRGRSFMWRLTTYWTLLTLGSVALAASFALSRSWVDLLQKLPTWVSWLAVPLSALGKISITWLLLLFAYTRMPNAQVRIRTAAVGALIAAVLWEAGKSLFVWFVKQTSQGQLEVYGSLALIPILLFWLYLTWHIVLIGLEVAWTLQTVGEARLRQRNDARMQAITMADPTAAVALMQHLASAFAKGEAMPADQLAQLSRIPAELVRKMIEKLIGAGMVHRVDRRGDQEAYALARAPASIGADEVVAIAMQLTPAASGIENNGSASSVESIRARLVESLKGTHLG